MPAFTFRFSLSIIAAAASPCTPTSSGHELLPSLIYHENTYINMEQFIISCIIHNVYTKSYHQGKLPSCLTVLIFFWCKVFVGGNRVFIGESELGWEAKVWINLAGQGLWKLMYWLGLRSLNAFNKTGNGGFAIWKLTLNEYSFLEYSSKEDKTGRYSIFISVV